MRLQSILVHGFKSFADKTEVKVFPGVTCIVGPNGCGKSNVADAIRWALGEQSPKLLRGQKMEDVIFHGTTSRRVLGMAEVSLIFRNDGTLSVPWSEVGVARRLYRTGESEYLLNGNVCRLRDIQDLFAGTGVNPKAYALMDQERLNHVLTAKPWERRVFIEEAAGIARYKQQRAETHGKLDATRQNLQRLRDVMEEVRRQLGSIERQARKARQYKALHQERQMLDLALLAADFETLAVEHQRLADEMAQYRRDEEETRVLVASLAARRALHAAAIQDTEYRLADLRQAVEKTQTEAERLLERREQMGLQIADLDEEDARLAVEVRTLGERRVGLEGERTEKLRALDEARERQASHAVLLQDIETRLDACRTALLDCREVFETLRVDQIRVASSRAELTRSGGELRERVVQLERRGERLDDEVRTAQREAGELATARDRLVAAHRQTGAQLSLLTAELNDLEVERTHLEERRAQQRGMLADMRVTLAARESAREALARLEREREGYGAGVRAIFSEHASGELAGVVGTVADLLDVPAGLETAVEAVLGDRLQWVVVERFEQARAALSYLEREGSGAASLLSLETLPPPADPPEDSAEIAWAARLIRGPRPALVSYLLGRVGVVAHLDQAEFLWRRNGVVATYVTHLGEVLTPTGRLTGGRRDSEREGNDQSILGRKRSIRQLDEELVVLRRDVENAVTSLAGLDAEISRLTARHDGLSSSFRAHEAAQLTSQKDVEAIGREEDRVQRHLETLDAERMELDSERAETSRRLEELDRSLNDARETEARLDYETREIGTKLDGIRSAETALVGEATACRVEAAAVSERVDALGRDVERLADLEREFGVQLEQAGRRRAQVLERRADINQERKRTDLQAREAGAERDRREAELAVVAEEHRDRVSQVSSVDAEANTTQHRLGEIVREIHQRELRETEGRVRREELFQEARRRHGVENEEALAAAHDRESDLEMIRVRHQELDAKIESMGLVNLVADEEYRELEERLDFLRTQHDDVVASIKDLEKALRGMTRAAQERFQEAFDDINRHFSNIFSRLFEGGRAELRVVPPEEGEDDPLELGVELMAQPRGKRLQAVTLMSGGEKALTGLALLFAIFYHRPSPFCVLDEVDAPLDDANIHRFLRVLRELTSQTQFIVITHNRKTMDFADVLYGVTMEEPGLSRLVSVRLPDA